MEKIFFVTVYCVRSHECICFYWFWLIFKYTLHVTQPNSFNSSGSKNKALSLILGKQQLRGRFCETWAHTVWKWVKGIHFDLRWEVILYDNTTEGFLIHENTGLWSAATLKSTSVNNFLSTKNVNHIIIFCKHQRQHKLSKLTDSSNTRSLSLWPFTVHC